MMIDKRWTVLALAMCVGLAACAADTTDEPSQSSESELQRGSGGGVTEGGACKITSGPNAGKSGTYDTTTDPGHTWCCTGAGGAGSCTECGGTPNKCSSALIKRAPDLSGGGTLLMGN